MIYALVWCLGGLTRRGLPRGEVVIVREVDSLDKGLTWMRSLSRFFPPCVRWGEGEWAVVCDANGLLAHPPGHRNTRAARLERRAAFAPRTSKGVKV